MSRFLVEKYQRLTPYVPGEQPQDKQYIKLNTNESPFPPSPAVLAKAAEAAAEMQLYSDPDCRRLREKLADYFTGKIRAEETARTDGEKALGTITPEQVIVTNGSDEVLNFAFMAFCGCETPVVFPDITYGFYPVFADMNGVPYAEIPLKEDFRIEPEDYENAGGTIFLANPNAHTGIALKRDEIEHIIRTNPDNLVVVDEAYVDFGAESCLPLVGKYDNVLVIQTFSKSRSLAGTRLGFGIGSKEIIRDMDTIRNSTNPYNVGRVSQAVGIAALEDDETIQANCRSIMANRQFTEEALKEMGFELTCSISNFIFMKHPQIDGDTIYQRLKERGVLVRHFTKERICQYNRVTIGSRRQMEQFLDTLKQIINETYTTEVKK